jgi:hypothetical protein
MFARVIAISAFVAAGVASAACSNPVSPTQGPSENRPSVSACTASGEQGSAYMLHRRGELRAAHGETVLRPGLIPCL